MHNVIIDRSVDMHTSRPECSAALSEHELCIGKYKSASPTSSSDFMCTHLELNIKYKKCPPT